MTENFPREIPSKTDPAAARASVLHAVKQGVREVCARLVRGEDKRHAEENVPHHRRTPLLRTSAEMRLSGGCYVGTSFAGIRLGKFTTAWPLAF